MTRLEAMSFFSCQFNGDKGSTKKESELEPPNQYFVAEERLIHLDIDGQPISGDLADHYVLEKLY